MLRFFYSDSIQDEIGNLRNEVSKISKVKEATLARIKTIEKQKQDVEKERDAVKQDMAQLEREVRYLHHPIL